MLSESVKSISYVKSHASEVINKVVESHEPVFITQNGEAKVVLQDLKEYEKQNESLAMLKMIAMAKEDLKHGRSQTADGAFDSLDNKIAEARAKYE